MTEEPISDALRILTGAHAGRPLAAAINAAGGRLVSWRPTQVDHRPGRVTVAYDARIRWGSAAHPRAETLGATAGGVLPPDVTVVGASDTRVGVWRFPRDPDLPGLAAAMDGAAMGALFTQLGLEGGRVRLRLRSYRPRRRAVVEARTASGRLFVKAVRPGRAQALHKRHRLIAGAGLPVPQSIGWTDGGLVVLQALPGRTLRDALYGAARPWPCVRALTDLLDRLPGELAVGAAGASWADRTGGYATRIGTVVPELATRVAALARTITSEAEHGPMVATHGDFYERQLLVDGGTVTGLLDIDTAGPGDRLDDLGCLVGHLSVLSLVWPQRAGTINDLAASYLQELDRVVDPAQLRLRIAAAVLSLATGPHRVQEPGWPQHTRQRVDLVEHWLGEAIERPRHAAPAPPRMKEQAHE